MPVPVKSICEKCRQEYLQSDMRIDHNMICDSCRGIVKKEPDNSIKSKEDWLDAIRKHQGKMIYNA